MNNDDIKMKAELKQIGITLRVRTRHLAHGSKRYFTVIPSEKTYDQPYYVVAKEIIKKYYPKCVLTSCGLSSATIAEY